MGQAQPTTYHPPTNGLFEKQNRTLTSILRVCCSRYMDDWDRHLSQDMGAYNSTEDSTTGISPHLMLTGHEKALPLTFFYPEYEGKKTAPNCTVIKYKIRGHYLIETFEIYCVVLFLSVVRSKVH